MHPLQLDPDYHQLAAREPLVILVSVSAHPIHSTTPVNLKTFNLSSLFLLSSLRVDFLPLLKHAPLSSDLLLDVRQRVLISSRGTQCAPSS